MARKLFSHNLRNMFIGTRLYTKRYDKYEGISFPGGFKYFPRHTNELDPQYEPTKLFMVKRIKPMKGNPHWEKTILKQFKLENQDIAIIKNIPENNARLWQVKHLVKITPIQFPHGEPTEKDIDYTYLRENGDLIVSKSLEIEEERLQITEKCHEDVKKLDGNTLRRQSRMKWLSGW